MPIQNVEVSVVMIASGEEILMVWNPRWGFSLPMTKRRHWLDTIMNYEVKEEGWQLAATRAAAEVFGHTLAPSELPQYLHEIKEFRQSDADGVWKLYNIQVFKMARATKPAALGFGVMGEWLYADQLKTHQPISRTVPFLLKELAEEIKLPPWK